LLFKLFILIIFDLGPITSAAGSSSSVGSGNCRKLEDPVYKKAKLAHSISKDKSATNVYK